MTLSARDLRDLPPDQAKTLPPLLYALWHDAHDDWHAAHETAQDIETPEGAWIHAYLHRREGDRVNAAYWYRRAGKSPATGTLEDEWHQLATALLR